MFTGHYGVSFGLKAGKNSVPLWVLFLAVQWIDVMWSIFVLLGLEHMRIVPGFTKLSPLEFYYMPYTHGLKPWEHSGLRLRTRGLWRCRQLAAIRFLR